MNITRLLRTRARPTRLLQLAAIGLILFTTLHEYTTTDSYRRQVVRGSGARLHHEPQKRHVLLWTQTRSGSRLTMQLLTAAPSSFTMEEPLRGQELETLNNSIKFLQDILNCNFSRRLEYFQRWMKSTQQEANEINIICNAEASLCVEPAMTEALCQAAHVNLVKVAAMELGMADSLLQDPYLSVRVVHLVRDPRALLASRLKTQQDFGPWVLGPGIFQEEKNLTRVCSRYDQDLSAARSFLRRFPDRYTLVRYEDLALHPHSEMRRLYTFLDLPYTAQVANTVTMHTLGFVRDASWLLHPFSTFRNASANVFAWRRRLPFREMAQLQDECGVVLQAYGYHAFPSPRHYHDLQHTPLLPLPPLL